MKGKRIPFYFHEDYVRKLSQKKFLGGLLLGFGLAILLPKLFKEDEKNKEDPKDVGCNCDGCDRECFHCFD